MPRPSYETLSGSVTADLLVVGAGYTGLWTALHAAQRNPNQKIVLVDAERVGWAASGRNGGFVDASLTHGAANGKARWPNEIDTLEVMGAENLDGMQADITQLGLDVDWQRTGMLSVATEPHQVTWLQEAADDGEGRFLTTGRGARRGGLADVPRGPVQPRLDGHRSSRQARVRARPRLRGCGCARSSSTPTSRRWTARADRSRSRRAGAQSSPNRPCWPPTSSPAWSCATGCRPFRYMTMCWQPSHSPTNNSAASDGPTDRESATPPTSFTTTGSSADNRIVWGGYDAIYHFGRKVKPAYEDRPASYRLLAAHFFITFPQLDDVRFSHRWAGAIDTNTRFCAHWGLARGGRVAYVNGFTGLGVGAARFAADVCLDLLDGRPTKRTELEMVRKRPLPFPPEPLASIGIQATRWSLDRADHSAGRRNVLLRTLDALGTRLRFLTVHVAFARRLDWADPKCPHALPRSVSSAASGLGNKTSTSIDEWMSPRERDVNRD